MDAGDEECALREEDAGHVIAAGCSSASCGCASTLTSSFRCFRLPGASVGETRVPKPRAYGENAPVRAALDVRQLAETLDNGVVVHDHHGFVIADLRYSLPDGAGKIEAVAFPIAGEVLPAARDRSILMNDTGAADPA